MRLLLACLLVPALALLAACAPPAGGGNSPAGAAGGTGASAASPPETSAAASEPAADNGHELVMGDNFFDPVELVVGPGAEIEVVNRGMLAHNVVDRGGAFEGIDFLSAGASQTITAPVEPGEYTYDCTFHPGMTGTLIVRAP
jgi:plastocyanin